MIGRRAGTGQARRALNPNERSGRPLALTTPPPSHVWAARKKGVGLLLSGRLVRVAPLGWRLGSGIIRVRRRLPPRPAASLRAFWSETRRDTTVHRGRHLVRLAFRSRSRRVRFVPLAVGLEQEDRAGNGCVERIDGPAQRDSDEHVAPPANCRPETLPLAADDDRQGP